MAQKPGKKQSASEIPVLEWITGAIGLLIVTATVGFLLYEGIAGDHSSPDIKVVVTSVAPTRNGFVARVKAENQGGEAAAQVTVEGAIRHGATVVESGGTVIDYLPAHSKRSAGLFFTKDPAAGELTVRARGYEEP